MASILSGSVSDEDQTMTTPPTQSDVLEILRTLPSESVRLFDLNIIHTDVRNQPMTKQALRVPLCQVSMNGISTVFYRTPQSWIFDAPRLRRVTTGLLAAGLRRSAQPVRRFASARSDTSPQNGCCRVPVSTIWLPLIGLLLAPLRYQLVPIIVKEQKRKGDSSEP
jgi:hypothetical protein